MEELVIILNQPSIIIDSNAGELEGGYYRLHATKHP